MSVANEKILIKNGRIVNADGILDGDILINGGVIESIGANLPAPPKARVIDATGKYVLPGGIDPHTHFEFQFMGTQSADDFFHGTKAAIAGGTTTIIDFVFPGANETLLASYDTYRKKADPKVCCDYGLHVCLPFWNTQARQDLATLVQQRGVNSFKVFMAYAFRLNDGEIYEAMEECRKLGALMQVHAENGDLVSKNTQRLLQKGVKGPEGHEMSRREEVESEAVNRVCVISRQVKCPVYIVHVMCKQASEAIEANRNEGCQVFGETLASALGTTGVHCCSQDFSHAAAFVMSPPIRSDPGTPKALMEMLSNNVLQATGSDNCTFNKDQKALGREDFSKIPNGVNGVEDRLSVLWEKGVNAKLLDLQRFVAVSSTNAAKIFNLYPKKGCLAVGSDADVVIWNPNKTRTISAKTHHHAVDFNIFEGMVIHGIPEYVMVRGKICVDNGRVQVEKGYGRFLETPPFAPYVYDQNNYSIF